ncbi:MAG TPA: hypothetical protein VJS37_20360 [Terriglobales bacterium]|nr:hypothetical protein [Terriglobales bacterium]
MRNLSLALLLLCIALCLQPMHLRAQENSGATDTKSDSAKPTATNQKAISIEPYRLDFSFNELENGKKINTRHYTITTTAGSANEIKIGSRVPLTVSGETSSANYQYIDLGTYIWAMLRDKGFGAQALDGLQLEVRSEISATKHEDVDVAPRAPHSAFTPPIISQIKINGATQLVVGKPMMIGIGDDPYSNRQFQLEVTATKLK